MIKGEDKYCDWCGKHCGAGSVDTLLHQFCSERCKMEYDNAHSKHATQTDSIESESTGRNLLKEIREWVVAILIGFAILIIISLIF